MAVLNSACAAGLQSTRNSTVPRRGIACWCALCVCADTGEAKELAAVMLSSTESAPLMVAPFGYVHRSASRMSLSDGRGKLGWVRRYRSANSSRAKCAAGSAMTASSSEKGMRSAMTASGGRPEDAAMLASAAQEPGPAGGRSGVGKVTAIKSVGTYAHRAVHSGGDSSAEGSSTKSAQLPAVLSLRTGARLVNPGKSEGQMAPNRGLLRHTHRGPTCC